MKEKKKIYLLVLMFILTIVLVGGYLLFFNNSEPNSEIRNNSHDEAIESTYEVWGIDDLDRFVMISDINLKDSFPLDKIIEVDIKTYDAKGNLINTYVGDTQSFSIEGVNEIHFALNDPNSNSGIGVASVTADYKISDRRIDARHEYEYFIPDTFEVVEFVSLYRIFLDLDDWYISNSGLAFLEYEDGTDVISRISYLDGTDYIGVAEIHNLGFHEGSPLEKISVYRIGNLRKID